MHNKVVAIIQARKGSTRLPSKVLLDLQGKTALEHVISRIQQSRLSRRMVVATAVNREDLPIVRLCADLGVSVYCGCAEDPLERYCQAARLFGAAHVVRIKADCPLIDPEIGMRPSTCISRREPIIPPTQSGVPTPSARTWKCSPKRL
jgi:spore coat polysaccharide biosynthesis protein SpsF